MRLFRISDYMTFLGDEGRDVLVVKEILEGNLTLLGPRASAGDFFTGPIYYYMMAPFLKLFNYDPVGPAVMVALIGVATVFLVFVVGRKLFGTYAGLSAAALYAVAPLVLAYSRSSWNPNPVPFFALLTMYLLYIALTEKKGWKYYSIIGFLLGIALQLHYISLFLAVIVAVSLLLVHWYQAKKVQLIFLAKRYLQIFGGFLVGFSPFLAFEFRHGFPNIRTIASFIGSDSTQSGYVNYNYFYEPIADVFFRLFGRLLFNYPSPALQETYSDISLQLFGLGVLIVAVSSIIALVLQKNKPALLMLSVWLIFGVALFAFYKKPIYDYYFVFMFPLPFLLVGNLFQRIATAKKNTVSYGIILSIILFLGMFSYALYKMPFASEPNRQKDQVRSISEFALSKTDGKPFNFALLTPANSDHGYRYYFEILGNKPVTIDNTINDPDRTTVTEQLIVICEDPQCNPEGHPQFEIAGFGEAEITGEWDYSVVKVFRLVPIEKSATLDEDPLEN